MSAGRPQARLLADGKRLHLQHGPIDCIAEAFGARAEVEAAYGQAVRRFETILDELAAELAELRRPAGVSPRAFASPAARRMEAAVLPLAEGGNIFLTPMAAVAGAVAEEVLDALADDRILQKAYVNNGGDAALHLNRGEELRLAIAGARHDLADRLTVRHADPVRGVATSGWRGRSFSLGLADAVTVLAATAAEADAAATVIANAVDLPGHPAVRRSPARALAPDSDLGERLVTVGVGPLTAAETGRALDAGLRVAQDLRRRGLIAAAALFLNDAWRVAGELRLEANEPAARLRESAHA